ncbi:MAG: hypothetical protein LC650_03090, partial [Actinobacteria bacterium]|nr:hypothetical protein [Actinomycetota bacterium]
GETSSSLNYDDIGGWFLTIRCNLKDYDDEIEKFIDWITPYTDSTGFVGYKRYEQDEEPTLIYL